MTTMYEQALMQAGLTKEQAVVYETLAQTGALKAGTVSRRVDLKRGLTYKVLEELIVLGLVSKEDTGGVARFAPAHPAELRKVAEKKERQARDAQQALDGALPQLTSGYNLAFHRPGIEFFEGKEGLVRMYERLLAAGKAIDSIEDSGEMTRLLGDYVQQFIAKRVHAGITNRVVAPSDNPINPSSPRELRETHFVPTAELPFRMDIKIAGDLVTLATFQKEHPVGVLLENPEIAENFRLLFNYLWKKTPGPVSPSSPSSPSGRAS